MELLQDKQKELQDHIVESLRLANELFVATQDKKYRNIKRGLIKQTLPHVNTKFAGAIKGFILGTQVKVLDEMYKRFENGFLSKSEPVELEQVPKSATNGGFGTKPPKSSFKFVAEKKNAVLVEDDFLKEMEARRAKTLHDVGAKKEAVMPVSSAVASEGSWGDLDVDENGNEIKYKKKEAVEPSREIIDALEKGEDDGAIEEIEANSLVGKIALMGVNDFHAAYGRMGKEIAAQLGIEEPKQHYKQLAAQIIQKAKDIADGDKAV